MTQRTTRRRQPPTAGSTTSVQTLVAHLLAQPVPAIITYEQRHTCWTCGNDFPDALLTDCPHCERRYCCVCAQPHCAHCAPLATHGHQGGHA